MASNYPGSLDAFDSIASDKKTSDVVGGRTHRDMHNDLGDAVEAVQAELGTDPAGTYSTVKARLDALVAYAAKTSAYTATVADHTLNVSSGTFTLDLPAASTCAGQSLRVKNSGSGVVTLDGNSSENVESVGTYPLGLGSYVEITSTGAAWIITGGTPDTGWRDVSASLANGWAYVSRPPVLRRTGRLVTLTVPFRLDGSSSTSTNAITIPSGFRRVKGVEGSYFCAGTLMTGTNNGMPGRTSTALIPAGFSLDLPTGAGEHDLIIPSTDIAITGTLRWVTDDAWPTSLPGSAA